MWAGRIFSPSRDPSPQIVASGLTKVSASMCLPSVCVGVVVNNTTLRLVQMEDLFMLATLLWITRPAGGMQLWGPCTSLEFEFCSCDMLGVPEYVPPTALRISYLTAGISSVDEHCSGHQRWGTLSLWASHSIPLWHPLAGHFLAFRLSTSTSLGLLSPGPVTV